MSKKIVINFTITAIFLLCILGFISKVIIPMNNHSAELEVNAKDLAYAGIPESFKALKLTEAEITKYKTSEDRFNLITGEIEIDTAKSFITYRGFLIDEGRKIVESYLSDLNSACDSLKDAKTLLEENNKKDINLAMVAIDNTLNSLKKAHETIEPLATKHNNLQLEKVRDNVAKN